jgi:hypothetical protein
MTQVFCGHFMAEGPDGHTTNGVLKASGLCGDRERDGGTGSPE